MQKVVVFFPTFNEAGNVAPLIDSILAFLPEAHILVVDDHSPDQTGDILDALARGREGIIKVIHRPRKMGIGSAHKLAMQYAIFHDYEILITMDADFSHHPKYLPIMMAALEKADFVTGSRYTRGGRCDYGLYRTFISRTANIVAKGALGLKLKENTTVYRGFRVSLLKRVDLDRIKSEGYSFAIESLYLISKHTTRMEEFPIHFENRREGKSKISRVEIYKAVLTILRLLWERIVPDGATRKPMGRHQSNGEVFCRNCGGAFHAELYGERQRKRGDLPQMTYSCSNHRVRTHNTILRCLTCGLVFMKPHLKGDDLVHAYMETWDPAYVEHIQARYATSRYNLNRVWKYMRPGNRLLDVGSYCGAFLKIAAGKGLSVTGVEPSAWAVGVSKEVIDAPVIRGTLDAVPQDKAGFYLITLWDVLEHFENPSLELQKIHNLLADDGYFFFSTLMIDNWFPRLTGKYWPWYMDMHLYYFTMPTLHDLLDRSGFRILESMNYCHIITAQYLLAKLGTLGIPGASGLAAKLSAYPVGKALIPFRFGDIKLFVCKKKRRAFEQPIPFHEGEERGRYGLFQ